jgi:hypothetical protein
MELEQRAQKAHQDLADAMREIYDALTISALNERQGINPAFKEITDKNNRALAKILSARRALFFEKDLANE